jgi:hypothetical protein
VVAIRRRSQRKFLDSACKAQNATNTLLKCSTIEKEKEEEEEEEDGGY